MYEIYSGFRTTPYLESKTNINTPLSPKNISKNAKTSNVDSNWYIGVVCSLHRGNYQIFDKNVEYFLMISDCHHSKGLKGGSDYWIDWSIHVNPAWKTSLVLGSRRFSQWNCVFQGTKFSFTVPLQDAASKSCSKINTY